MSKRRQNFENIAWFLDLHKRDRLEMDPPFQRRSVWNSRYRTDFIDTILLDHPAPAIFLFSDTTESGATAYQLVDGKQRLETIFRFVAGEFPVGDRSPLENYRGVYFESRPKELKIAFFQYDFSVEYLPTNNESIIDSVFDRLNRNVVKLTSQELRHARLNGRFTTAAEELRSWMDEKFKYKLPNIAETSRRQMKDVEVVATLLLFLEEGVKGYSTLTLDQAFSDRDEEWEAERGVTDEFRATVGTLEKWVKSEAGYVLTSTRLRNQADFYSLFAAVAELTREKKLPDEAKAACERLSSFTATLGDEQKRDKSKGAAAYYAAARSASNDPGPRRTRIDVVKRVLLGEPVASYS